MSKLLDDLKRAAEARWRVEQTRAPDPAHPGFDENKHDKSALRGREEADPTQQALAWLQSVRAARELSKRDDARTERARWLLATAASGIALTIGIGIGSLVGKSSEPAAVSPLQPAAQMQPGPPLQLRLDTDLEQFGRRAGATAPGRGAKGKQSQETE